MATFTIYTYQFAPLLSGSNMENSLFKDEVITADSVMRTKQRTFQSLFDGSSDFVFYANNQVYKHQILLNYNGIIVLRIANNKTISQEEDFKVRELLNQPSCIVVIDNRGDCQSIAIQRQPHAFSSTDHLARIMMVSFNGALKGEALSVDIRHRIEENSFWKIVELHPEGIRSIRFEISYPNLPRVAENVDELFREICKEFGANSKYEINAVQGQTLNLDRSSRLLNGLVKASSDSGHDIKLLSAKPHSRWVSTGTGSYVMEEISDDVFQQDEDKLFDDRYERIAEKMNRFK